MSPAKPATYAIQVAGKPNKKSKTRPVVHYLSGVLEMTHSEMSAEEIAAAKTKRDEFTLKKTPERPVAVVYATSPSYPEALRATGEAGTAKILCRIGVDGRVTESTIQEASAPEFGQAAQQAAQTWLFAPAIKDGQFVEADILVPVDFSPTPR
jgi:TonB family protein